MRFIKALPAIFIFTSVLSQQLFAQADNVTFKYSLTKAGTVTLIIRTSTDDQQVRLLLDNVPQSAGQNAVEWNGANDNGNDVASGEYRYHLYVVIDGATYEKTGWVHIQK
ncbi:MAG: hypothetical protein HYR76_06725 [Ignavibacteria bacterium]|nr:hypothetical protein [Ignavibacteria bacterium]